MIYFSQGDTYHTVSTYHTVHTCKNSQRLEAKNMGKMYKIYGVFGKSVIFVDIGHSFDARVWICFLQQRTLCAKSYIEVMYRRKMKGTLLIKKIFKFLLMTNTDIRSLRRITIQIYSLCIMHHRYRI